MPDKRVSLGDVDMFYRFLQGEVPECLSLREPPNLSKVQAFGVIYYLQEVMGLLSDTYEQCNNPECRDLYDSDYEGCLAGFCGGCECQYPDGFDPKEDEGGCLNCPLYNEDEPEGSEGR